jgi:D-3-phosphoglycerate dehydrogenase / 2-oxoglutarate reductase
MTQRINILIAESDDFSPNVIAELSTIAEVDLANGQISDLKKALSQYDVFWFRLAHKIDSSVLTPQSKCKILVTPVTGIDHIDEKLCEELGVKIICLRGERTFLKEVKATAEHTMGLMLALMRYLVPSVQSVKSGVWNRDLFRGNELYKKTLGIVGFGRLGALVAEYAHVFGMRVVAFDIRKEVQEAVQNVVFIDNINDLVQMSDIVSIHVNYTPATHHLINQQVFSLSKKDSFFINTSRGGIVDENALLEALQTGKLKGAAVDVLQNEHALNEENSLVQYAINNDNLIITPHIGGNTFESFEKTEMFVAHKLMTYLNTIRQ